MGLTRLSPCKVNLLLNILGKRPDGFHELETVLFPVRVHDELDFERAGTGIELECDHHLLPTNDKNLVFRAATLFREALNTREGVHIRLRKRIPLEAGLGGGSGDAATTLLGLNELFGHPLPPVRLQELAAQLGSDVAFFLQPGPALGQGRGERVERLPSFSALAGMWFLLVHPGFGVSTAWAYGELARYPAALDGEPGRARRLISRLQANDLEGARPDFYNALEVPVFFKYPLLAMFQEFFREQGATVALMSGSGSTTFGIFRSQTDALRVREQVRARFGTDCWTACVPVEPA